MSNTTHATNKTIAEALRILAGDIQSPDDVPAATLRQAATRIEELGERVRELGRAQRRIRRLESAGDKMQSALVGEEGLEHWQYLAEAHEAELAWRKAKEATL